MPYPYSKVSLCLMPFAALMWQEGNTLYHYIFPCLLVAHRDVTDHLQLLLRKSGHHLHTTAEREVVRTIKEKCCYVALNPSKEEKDAGGRTEEFKLPDGNVVQVYMFRLGYRDSRLSPFPSLVLNASVHLKSSSILNWSGKSMQVFIKWLSIRSTASI